MVFFTCNACGQTVKKSKVEKHYQTECRDCAVLSCLDCGKDFHGDDYALHTSCISEAEKYQGKLYKDSNRGQPPKGEKKQQAWLEKVKQAATSLPAANPRVAKLLERLQEYTNIPRKMKKFQNFVKNSLNVRDQKTLDELWSMFSGIQASADDAATSGAEADKKPEASTLEDSTISVDEIEVDKVKKKKKKSKHSEEDNTEATSAVGDKRVVCSEEDILSSTKKKHKKKKHHDTDSEDITINTNQLDIQLLSDSQPPAMDESVIRKKKKSKKKLSADQVVEHVTDGQDTVEDAQCAGTDNGVEDNINHWLSSITESGVVKKKKKKDKHKDCNVTDNVTDSSAMELADCNTESAGTALTDGKQSKCKERIVNDQVDMEDGEVTVVERKKKRKSKIIAEDVPVGKKTKLQAADNETEIQVVKKHKKKKSIE